MVHAAVLVPLGPTAAGPDAVRPYRPTLLSLAQALGFAAENDQSLLEAVPIPAGMNLWGITHLNIFSLRPFLVLNVIFRIAVNPFNEQVQLIFELDVHAIRLKRAFGFAGDIKLTESQGTPLSPQTPPLNFISNFKGFEGCIRPGPSCRFCASYRSVMAQKLMKHKTAGFTAESKRFLRTQLLAPVPGW